jgi:putative molybdopterin biosynthesis protein
VLAGDADVGLGLRVTADRLDTGFVRLGTERVRVWAADDRLSKPGVTSLRALLTDGERGESDEVSGGRRLPDILSKLPGYD